MGHPFYEDRLQPFFFRGDELGTTPKLVLDKNLEALRRVVEANVKGFMERNLPAATTPFNPPPSEVFPFGMPQITPS
jgi:hypothetical protein